MGLIHLVSPGEREWFRRCRRSWDLASPNRQNFEPQTSAGVSLRRAVQDALDVWYFPGMWEWPRAVVLPRALQAFDEAVAGRSGRPDDPDDEMVEGARRMLERYFAWAPTVDAFAPVRVEADFEANVPDRRNPGHDLVDGDGRPVRYHDRVPLLIVDAHDMYWVVEHRLAEGGWAERDELLLAERPVAGAWGWEQFYIGMVIVGTVHNELRVAGDGWEEGEPGEGKAARRPRSRDWARSRAAGRDPARRAAGSSVIQAGPAEAVVQEGGGWFRRTWIRRSRAEVEAVAERLCGEVLDMLDPNLALYPSPSPDHCGRCDFLPPCLAMNQGADVQAVLTTGYRRRPDDRPPEEGRLGGGTWSMNRGAAPPPQWRKPQR
jgi:hypothetical protein